MLHYFFGRYTVLAAGSAVLYCIHMQHCTYIICSYSICICCLHILSAVWGLSSLAFFPYSICELEFFHILSPGLLLYIYMYMYTQHNITQNISYIYILYIYPTDPSLHSDSTPTRLVLLNMDGGGGIHIHIQEIPLSIQSHKMSYPTNILQGCALT